MNGASTRSFTSEEDHREAKDTTPPKTDQVESQPCVTENLSQTLNLQLTAHKLNGQNYLEWAHMERRSRLGYMTGEVK